MWVRGEQCYYTIVLDYVELLLLPLLLLMLLLPLLLLMLLLPHPRAGLEIVEQVPDVDVVVIPVGGAGLIAGMALAIKTLRPQCQVALSCVMGGRGPQGCGGGASHSGVTEVEEGGVG